MKTSNLTGALLDYWVARAEGIPADQLSIRQVPRTDWTICVHTPPGLIPRTLAYSTDWALGGPLIEKHCASLEYRIGLGLTDEWLCVHGSGVGEGATPLQAVCRAVVVSAFSDNVEELPC